MATSIADFKQAFAGKASDNGLQERDKQTRAALLRLKAAIDKSGGANGSIDGFKAALTKLVEHYDAVLKQAESRPADAGAELDKIHRQTQLVTERVEGAPAESTPPPAETQSLPIPSDTAGPDGTPLLPDSAKAGPEGGIPILVAFTVVDQKGKPVKDVRVRNGSRESRTDAGGRVVMYVPGEANQMFTFWSDNYEFAPGTDPHGSKATLFIEMGTSPVYREIRMKRTWVTVTAIVIDAATGKGIKDAWIPDYRRSEADGRVLITMRAETKRDIRAIADGYITQEDTITVKDADTEHIVRLTPIGKAGLEKRLVKITIGGVKGSVNWPVAKAKVTIGGQSLIADDYGVVKLQLAPGFQPYTVNANGFKEEKGKLEIYQANSKELQSKEMSLGISVYSLK